MTHETKQGVPDETKVFIQSKKNLHSLYLVKEQTMKEYSPLCWSLPHDTTFKSLLLQQWRCLFAELKFRVDKSWFPLSTLPAIMGIVLSRLLWSMLYMTSAAAAEHIVFLAPPFLSEDLPSGILVLSQPPEIQTWHDVKSLIIKEGLLSRNNEANCQWDKCHFSALMCDLQCSGTLLH